MNEYNEPELVRKAKDGDEAAFEQLVKRHERLVYSVAYKMLGNEQDAQDASQEAFVKAYLSLQSFAGQSRFSVWLYRLTSNVCIDMLRKREPARQSLSAMDEDGGEEQLDIPDERFSPETELERRELRRSIDRGLMSLSPEYRQVLILRELGGHSYDEISAALELDKGTVKSRIFRARKKLCAFLAADGNLPDRNSSKKGKGGAQA